MLRVYETMRFNFRGKKYRWDIKNWEVLAGSLVVLAGLYGVMYLFSVYITSHM